MAPLVDRARVAASGALERGAWGGPIGAIASRAWGAWSARSIARPLAWREGTRAIAVGGATLGGSGKTPLAIACARELARRGERVALIAHAYRADPRVARHVPALERADDVALATFGDEALLAARALSASGARVVVAPSRQAAVRFAEATGARVLVLDGPLQTRPRRASLSLLALDAHSPWGANAPPPAGDLRAPRIALLAACDRLVRIADAHADADADAAAPATARARSLGAHLDGRLVPWPALAPLRIALFTALARPERLLVALARRGIAPTFHLRAPDHARPRALPPLPPADLILASPKCALVLEAARVPHAVIDHTIHLDSCVLAPLETPA